jgi:hypothetical protein
VGGAPVSSVSVHPGDSSSLNIQTTQPASDILLAVSGVDGFYDIPVQSSTAGNHYVITFTLAASPPGATVTVDIAALTAGGTTAAAVLTVQTLVPPGSSTEPPPPPFSL